jgi:NADP-dependent 3-hydroxy acid dehydrogenase YdfG
MTMDNPPSLTGKVAIVTGASSGIGEATARELAHAGVITVLAARRRQRLERLAEEIRAAGGSALPVPTDLTDPAQITQLVQTTLAKFGRIDILANIAGGGHYDWFEAMSAEELRNQYEVNIIGLAELTRQVIPTMKAQRAGVILNMSSYASRIAVPPLTVYASTKYAVEGLTDGLRRELIPWGIKVIRIHPSGVTGTEFNELAGRGGVHYRSFPLGKVSRERVAQAIVRLVEQPRPALFLSRLYDVPVAVNKLFPDVVDRLSAAWVHWKRRHDLRQLTPAPEPGTLPARYPHRLAPLSLVVLLFSFILLRRLLKKKV